MTDKLLQLVQVYTTDICKSLSYTTKNLVDISATGPTLHCLIISLNDCTFATVVHNTMSKDLAEKDLMCDTQFFKFGFSSGLCIYMGGLKLLQMTVILFTKWETAFTKHLQDNHD